jgi:rSAM/selenodomain-associated transferase 1
VILVFVKYPEPGRVKTRLTAWIGADAAAELYRAFVADVLATVKTLGFPFQICFYPEDKRALMLQWLGEEYHYVPQRGKNLGERMKYGFVDAFADENERVVITGSDAPDLPLSILRRAFDGLTTHDVVIGPSQDGGYYLIGFRRDTFLPPVFDNIPWSTPTVFDMTMSILHDQGLKVSLLPEWQDVDTVGDIKRLVQRCPETSFVDSHTMAFIVEKLSFILHGTLWNSRSSSQPATKQPSY